MKKHVLVAAGAAFALSSHALAQSAQEQLDTRYDRALAAGYKAMMLCSAIANAELTGSQRSPESVHQWELAGIQAPLNDMVQGLPYKIVRTDAGHLRHVRVTWSDDMLPRIARHDSGFGCVNLPIGSDPDQFKLDLEVLPREPDIIPPATSTYEYGGIEFHLRRGLDVAGELEVRPTIPLVLGKAFGELYGEGRTTAVVLRTLDDEGELSLQLASYAPGFDAHTPQRTWSVAKSIAATLVGAAAQSGEPCVSAIMPTQLTKGAAEPRRRITVDHLLRMASGRYSDTPGNRTDPLYWGGTSVDERAANWPIVHEPGTVYRYANNDTLMAVQSIECYLEK
ncbi:MAG: serine hydrolase domain-containing protein, partial [Pseudomonadota bacterium]